MFIHKRFGLLELPLDNDSSGTDYCRLSGIITMGRGYMIQ